MEGNHYEEVILDLQRKRDELGAVINLLMKLGNPKPVETPTLSAAPVIEAPTKRFKTFNRRKKKFSEDEVERVCKKCGDPKPLDEFVKANGCIGGYSRRCKACKSTQDEERKAKKRGRAPGDLPIFPRECALCRDPFSGFDKYKDHMKRVHGKDV
jgi:hypothetical protein